MPVSFRVATTGDINEILRMMTEFNAISDNPFDKEVGFKNLVYLLNHPEVGKTWLLSFNEKTIGYVVLTFGFSFKNQGKDVFIDQIFIKSPYRGKGFGKKTLVFVADQAKDLGAKAIHLESITHNVHINTLFKSAGFSENDRMLLTKQIL